MTIVDAHLHVWRAAEEGSNSVRVIVPPQTDVPLELAEETFDDYAVSRGVLVQPAFRGEDNSYLASCIRQSPDQFAGVCVVDPRQPNAELRLRYWVDRGFRGVRIRPRFSEEAECFGDPSTYPLWHAAQELRVVVSLLAGPEHLTTVARMAERFPDVPIVIDHLAHPDVTLGVGSAEFRRLLDLAAFPNIWLKSSGFYHFSRQRFPYGDCHEFIRAVVDRFGAQRMMWGSDFPHVLLSCGYRRALELPEAALPSLTDSDRYAVMAGNALRLYW
ncbi:MAG: amidohydrolase family protein [Planctomycetota bacterium]|nr:amidohydrolase family protein [Planctomycetota bacterium]MDA1179276.1 amidohydrolase family protein [Planctomycetota bacterium]